MIDVDVTLYLVSPTRIARMVKPVAFAALPRVGEFVKLRNRSLGEYFAFTATQITHREGGPPDVWCQLLTALDGRPLVSFLAEPELDEYVAGYEAEGWKLASLVPNRTSMKVSLHPSLPRRSRTKLPPHVARAAVGSGVGVVVSRRLESAAVADSTGATAGGWRRPAEN